MQMMEKPKPVGKRLLCLPSVEEETTTPGGLVIPAGGPSGEHLGRTMKVVVLGVTVDAALGIKEGDTILVKKYSGWQVEGPKWHQTMYVIDQEDVLLIL